MFAWWQSAAPNPAVPLVALALIGLIGSASITLWIRFAARATEGQQPLAYEPRRAVPWTIFDLIALVLVFLSAAAIYARLYLGDEFKKTEDFDTYQTLVVLVYDAVTKLTVLAAALVSFRSLRGATPEDWGLVAPRSSDFLIAGVAAIAIMPPVYLLNAWLISIEPTQHPLIRALAEGDSPLLRLGTVISAGLFAPVFEELFFRSVLQGWLERVLLHRHETPAEADVDAEIVPDDANGGEYAVVSSAPHGWWLPIVISSAVFAAAHLDFSKPRLDFIPLFFFACVLGYLYQRTHRILPSILLHMALNLSSLAMLFAVGPSEMRPH
jgi:membrane protease YdiL (CAAX protease family)